MGRSWHFITVLDLMQEVYFERIAFARTGNGDCSLSGVGDGKENGG